MDALTLRLREIKAQHALSYEAIANMMGFSIPYVRGMHNGTFKTPPRVVRLLELELAEQRRNRRKRA